MSRGPEWTGWEAVMAPQEIAWILNSEYKCFDCFIGGRRVAWIEPRPSYCDRGHWKMGCELPDIDAADSFPRYYMDFGRALAEAEAFLRWRLWQEK